MKIHFIICIVPTAYPLTLIPRQSGRSVCARQLKNGSQLSLICFGPLQMQVYRCMNRF